MAAPVERDDKVITRFKCGKHEKGNLLWKREDRRCESAGRSSSLSISRTDVEMRDETDGLWTGYCRKQGQG